MSETNVPKKSEALRRVREALTRCPLCGEPFDVVECNSHRTTPAPESLRFYFQFIHGEHECVDFTMAVNFEEWLVKSLARGG